MLSGNFAEMTTSTPFRDLLHAANLRHGNFQSTLPNSASFDGSETEMPLVVLGDEACPLKTSLLKPSARKDLACEERVCIYRLSRARRCVA